MYKVIFSASMLAVGLHSHAQSLPYANDKTIGMDSSVIICWATGIELSRGWVNAADTSVKYDGKNKASFGVPFLALGKASADSFDVLSLGDGGQATVSFDRPITNGQGPDFAVFGNAMAVPSGTYSELAFVEVSSDGKRFVRFPAVSLTQATSQVGSFAGINPGEVHNLAGKNVQGQGTAFDLQELKDSSGIDLHNIHFVRLIDVVGSIDAPLSSRDSKGNTINDPFPTPYASSGFDLDAVGAINVGQALELVTFDELSLPADTAWRHTKTDSVYTFASGSISLAMNVGAWSWSGFTYSNMRDDSTAGYVNQYSAITAGGMNAGKDGGTNYLVSYVDGASTINFSDNKTHHVKGMYVTNATYPYLSMKNGDAYSKKFGGANGNDPDFLKIIAWGMKADSSTTDTVEFFLADFRSADNSKDYIVDGWAWMDLSSLGEVKNLNFSMTSTDVGDWGINTPLYFCIDNITLVPDDAPVSLSLQELVVRKNSEPLSLSLHEAFTAYNAKELTFAVNQNTGNDIVEASVSGSNLVLTFAPGEVGETTVTISASLNGKTEKNTVVVKVVEELTTETQPQAARVRVFPNPCAGVLSVETPEACVLRIIDVSGKVIAKSNTCSGITHVETETLDSGIYIIDIQCNEIMKTIFIAKK